MNTPFELRTLLDERRRARLFLLQLPRPVDRLAPVDEPRTVGRLSDTALQGVYEVLDIIVQPYLDGERGTDSSKSPTSASADRLAKWRTERTIPLEELPGMRVLLLCHAVGALRSNEKITNVARSLINMDEEDVMYWSRKVSDADSGRKRFIMFVTGAL